MSFFRFHILITPFVLCLPLYYVRLPFRDYDYSFCVIFAIVLCPSSVYTFWLLLLTYFCYCSISFFRIQIVITPFVLFLPLYYVLLLFTDPVYSFCVIFGTAASPSSGYRFWLLLLWYFAIVLCPSSVYRSCLLLLCYFCHCSISFFRIQILITPFVIFLPLYYVLLPFENYGYPFCVMFAIVLCPSSAYRFRLLILCNFLPLYYLLLPITDSDISFCVIYAIVLCPSSAYTFWILLLCYFCHCSISFFRLQILITPFYFIFAIALCPSSVYKLWLLLLCYFCHCIMSFFRLHILITPFDLFLPLQHLLLPDTDSDYSFCVIFAIVLCPSSDYRFWLLLLCYFCHCSISFFRLQILITPFVLFLPLYYVLLPFTNYDYSFCVSFAIVLCPSSIYKLWLLLLCYFCHCIMSFFRLQIMITPFVLFLPLYYVLLPFTHSDYSFWLIFAIAASPSSDADSDYSLCVILPLYYVLLLFTDSDYSFCVIFATAASPSSGYRFWLLLLCCFCHCIMSFCLQILITPFVLFLPLQHLLLPVTDSDYSFCVVFAIVLCPSSVYKLCLLLLC